MTIPDILISYLSFGAPFAVYYLIQERQNLTYRVFFKTLLRFLFWLPFLVRPSFALLKSVGSNYFAAAYDLDAELDENIRKAQLAIADRFRMAARPISIHEFREISDRYAGLSRLVKEEVSGVDEIQNDLYDLVGRKNAKLAAVCIERRNRTRINRHHIDARREFLNVIMECGIADRRILRSVMRLTELLGDSTASAKLFANLYTRNLSEREINQLREDLWIPEIQPASKSERLTVTQ